MINSDRVEQTKPKPIDITSLPFGSEKLISGNYPQKWDASYFLEEDTIPNPYEDDLYKLLMYYHVINKPPSIMAPEIKSYEFIQINSQAFRCTDSINFRKDFKYRLPDLGHYEVYYIAGNLDKDRSLEISDNRYFSCQYGNLLLYDSKSKSARILNIYSAGDLADELLSEYRFFYIGRYDDIKIYEANEYEIFSSLKHTATIKILNSGEISIEEVK